MQPPPPFDISILTDAPRPPRKDIYEVPPLRRLWRIFYNRVIEPAAQSRRRQPRRGPGALALDLRKGLRDAGMNTRWNPCRRRITRHVHALAHAHTVRWAIELKRNGKIDTLIAGPNICLLPTDDDCLIASPEVDACIVPSEWCRRMYEELLPPLQGRVYVWAGGTDATLWSPTRSATDRNFDFLVFDKIHNVQDDPLAEPGAEKLVEHIERELQQRRLTYRLIRYGQYDPRQFRALLRDTRAMIYISRSESQGLALQETWLCDVPTLVWDRGVLTLPGFRWEGASSCPYLNAERGMRFSGSRDFSDRLTAFWEKAATGGFAPRENARNELAIEPATRKYMELWAEVAQTAGRTLSKEVSQR